MKILHVANGNQRDLGTKFYFVDNKVNNGLIRNGHNVIFFSDRDEARNNGLIKSKKFGIKHCNKKLITVCKEFRPDFILLGHADLIKQDTYDEIRKILPGIKIAQYNVDPIFRDANVKNILSRTQHVDATFITTGGKALKKFSSKKSFTSFIPNPVDSSIESFKSFENKQAEYDLFYAIRPSKKHEYSGDPRIEIPLFIKNNIPSFKPNFHGLENKPAIFGTDYYNEISNSKMGLNLSVNIFKPEQPVKKDELYLYSSDRISQYMGCGLLTFTRDENSLNELFTDKEIVYFKNKEDLCDKVKYYKENNKERIEIAKSGWKKYHNNYNEKLISQYIIEQTLGTKHSHNYAWPVDKF